MEKTKLSNPLENARSFNWHTTSTAEEVDAAINELYEILDKKKKIKGNPSYNKRNLKIIVLDLYLRYLQDETGYLKYRRGSPYFKRDKKLNPHRINRASLARCADSLDEFLYVENITGFFDRRSGGKRRISRVKANKKLIDFLQRRGVKESMIETNCEQECIILRNKNKIDAPYKDTRNTESMRKLLVKYNQLLNNTYIDILAYKYIAVVKRSRKRKKIGKKRKAKVNIDLNQTFVRRVFNNQSWKQGGRFYGGWWQWIPSQLRKNIIIQGKPTIEIDYSAMHIVILYAMEGNRLFW